MVRQSKLYLPIVEVIMEFLDEDINTSAIIIPFVEILGPIT
jgi:hypothetical protein